MPAMTAAIDLQKYTDWFVWARDTLARELDATHAAAEAAYRSAAGGASDDDAQAAARAAGPEPSSLEPQTMALAEWAAWALATGRFRDDQAVTVARYALPSVESGHDLDATMADVMAVAPPISPAGTPAGTPVAAPSSQPRSNRNSWIIAGAVVGLLVLGGATAGVIGSISAQEGSPPAGKPSFSPAVQVKLVSTGVYSLTGQGFPPNTTVYVFVDRESQGFQQTLGDGSLQLPVSVPIGGHTISVCLDNQELTCPATTFISRDH